MSNSEAILQQTLISLLRACYPDFVINLSLNGISLNGLAPKQKAQIIRDAKLQGMEPGTPDLAIYLPGSQVLNLELKRPVGGKQSDEQLLIESKLHNLGHNYHIIRDYLAVFKLIANLTTTEYRTEAYIVAQDNIPADFPLAADSLKPLFHI